MHWPATLGLSAVRRLPGANVRQPPARLLLECLRDREDDVLGFLSDLRIPPTSHGAGLDLRPAKTQQKISGRLRSEDVTRHRYAIGGSISTAARHGADLLAALRDAFAGKPCDAPYPRQRLNHARQPSRSASTHNPDAKICMLTSGRCFR